MWPFRKKNGKQLHGPHGGVHHHGGGHHHHHHGGGGGRSIIIGPGWGGGGWYDYAPNYYYVDVPVTPSLIGRRVRMVTAMSEITRWGRPYAVGDIGLVMEGVPSSSVRIRLEKGGDFWTTRADRYEFIS